MWPAWTSKFRYSLIGLILGIVFTVPSFAQSPARIDVERLGETVRLNIVLPENEGGDLSANAELAANQVVVANLSSPISVELSGLRQDAAGYIAMARLDPDGKTMRLALSQDLEPRVSISHNVIALDLAPPGAAQQQDVVSPYELMQIDQAAQQVLAEEAKRLAAEAALKEAELPALPVEITYAESDDFTRITFNWPQSVNYNLDTSDNRSVLRFSRKGLIDLSIISVNAPRFVEGISTIENEEGLAIEVQTSPDTVSRVWSHGGNQIILGLADGTQVTTESVLDSLREYATAINQSAPETYSDNSDQPSNDYDDQAGKNDNVATVYREPEYENPVPETGIVSVSARRNGNDLILSFPWTALPGASVFRRSEAIWVVFDARAELDIASLRAAGSRHFLNARTSSGRGYTALRLESPASTQADLRSIGSIWQITLTDSISEPSLPIHVTRDTGFNRPATILIKLEDARRVARVADPIVGDTLLVLTAAGPKRGIITPRYYAESRILPSTHGVAVELLADDLTMTRQIGGAVLGREGGLALSKKANLAKALSVDKPVSPGFVDLERWRGDKSYLENNHSLQMAALDLKPEALLALARFHLGWELSFEAMAYLNQAIAEDSTLEPAAETAALLGVAQIMAGRYSEADETLNHLSLVNDPAAQPWRGLLAIQQRDWSAARRRFEVGRESMFFFDPVWRSRLTSYHALSALKTNDLGAVQPLLNQVKAGDPDPEALAIAEYTKAGLDARTGDISSAIARYDNLSNDPWRPIQAKALLSKTILQAENELIDPENALQALEALRFRWRGDDTEVEAAAMLGQIYVNTGRYEDALQIMKFTQERFSESPVSRQLSEDMMNVFRHLFLDGGSDSMDALSAVALWREYQELTPTGPDGVRMVMNMVRRLVELDLLDQAATYLQYWIDENSVTLTAQARARIARDLAEIYIMDGRPELALTAIESTRIAGLPRDIVDERRLLQARALSKIGRADHALELISNDKGVEADRLRASIAWDGKLWPEAGRRVEAMLGNTWREGSLTPNQAHDVMRAMIAYALSRDTISMDRIKARYGPALAQTSHAAAFSMISQETVNVGDARIAALVDELANYQASDTLLEGFKRTGDETG